MNGFLISIVGLSLIALLVDILLQDKDNMAFIKSIYSLIVLIVIFKPIIGFLKNFKGNEEISIDYNFVETLVEGTTKDEIILMLNSINIYDFFIFVDNDLYKIYIYENIDEKQLLSIEDELEKLKIKFELSY